MLTACGGGSASGPVKEASADDVGALVETPVDVEDTALTEEVVGDTEDTTYKPKKADWIPEIDGATSSKISKINYNPSVLNVSQKVISTGDNTTGWIVYDRTPAGATITSVNDADRGGKVLKLTGEGLKNGSAIGYTYSHGSTWNDTENKTIKWSMKYSEDFMIYVRLTTEYGYRYLYYTDSNKDYGEVGYKKPHYIHNGLGTTSNDGTWRTFTRNLSADLKRHQPMNKIISVDGFFVRGSGLIDDVELLKSTPTQMDQVIYEDAEDGKNNRWKRYTSLTNPDNDGTITNVNDTEKSSRVIEVKGNGLHTGYMLGAWKNENRWKNTINKEISWDMKYSEDYVVYISIETESGHRFMTYSPMSTTTCTKFRETGELVGSSFGSHTEPNGDKYISLGLCPDTKNGTWQTVARDLEHDLQKYEPSNSLKFVNAFLIRGSGRLDNIKMFDTNTVEDPDRDTSS
jgi:hypothetical protein